MFSIVLIVFSISKWQFYLESTCVNEFLKYLATVSVDCEVCDQDVIILRV